MPNISPGITIPGIPSGGNFGYNSTLDQVVYDSATHIGGQPTIAGISSLVQALQNQANNLLPANVWNMENGTVANWSAQNGTAVNVTTGPAHSGTHSIQFTGNGVGANGNLLFTNGLPNNLGYILPASYIGQQISMSAWCYNATAPLRLLRIQCAFYTAASALITPTYTGSPIQEVQNTWMLAPPLTVVVPSTANTVIIYCGATGAQTLGEVRYFDDYALAPI